MMEAKSGGFSDPRNGAMMKIFNMINIGERTGNGIPSIYYLWDKQGWTESSITQSVKLDRVTLYLPLKKEINSNPTKSVIKSQNKKLIISYPTDHVDAKSSELSQFLGLQQSRTRDYLKELLEKEIIVTEGNNKNRIYKLKS